MLVIRRRAGESILIGGNIEVRLLEISGGRAILGLSAPPEVLILRREIHLAREQNQAAQRFSSSSLNRLLAGIRPPSTPAAHKTPKTSPSDR